jgi:uncharacterized protein YutE (UPF0331/DUF86 family)
MARRVSFSNEHRGLPEIVDHHVDLDLSLRLYFSKISPTFDTRFLGYSTADVAKELAERINEIDLSSSLAVLASLEAVFRIDYLQRCYRRGRDTVSRIFREIYKEKESQARLDEDIFQTWADNSTVPRQMIGDLRGAFRFRHWLAHGRYWTPKLGRKYSFNDVFALGSCG